MKVEEVEKICKDTDALQNSEEIMWLFNILDKVSPLKTIVEIGLEWGGSLKLWEHYLLERFSDYKDILVIGIDMDMSKIRWDLNKSLIHFSLLNKNTFDDDLPKCVKDILGNREIDYLMIDGNHSYEGVRNDFNKLSPLVRAGGVIAFHDVRTEWDKVGKFVKELNYPSYNEKLIIQGTGIIIK